MNTHEGDDSLGDTAFELDLLVIGLGYVGLPLAHAATLSGLSVAGFDISKATVDGLNSGRSHIDDISGANVREMLERGFKATDDVRTISKAHAITICVPTPLQDGGGPDLAAVEAATSMIAEHLTPRTLVVLESTTYPGTTNEVVLPTLAINGREVGRDFFLAFSPERVDPGNRTYGITNTPKVVGGVTAACTERAARLYERFVDEVVVAKGPREAEMAKLLENTYRHVNIALINELAQFSHELDIDIWDVIQCASSKPFGFQAFYPGPGVGGHCIPIDPNYLSHRVQSVLGRSFRFIELAQEINASMPSYVVQRVQDLLNEDAKAVNGSQILLVGVAYKPNVSDTRHSPAENVARQLQSLGARVAYCDPLVPDWLDESIECVPASQLTSRTGATFVVLQHHSGLTDSLQELARSGAKILDTKGRLTGPRTQRL